MTTAVLLGFFAGGGLAVHVRYSGTVERQSSYDKEDSPIPLWCLVQTLLPLRLLIASLIRKHLARWRLSQIQTRKLLGNALKAF